MNELQELPLLTDKIDLVGEVKRNREAINEIVRRLNKNNETPICSQ